MVLLMACSMIADAQTTDTWWINQGLNGSREKELGEFTFDVGGHVPFAA